MEFIEIGGLTAILLVIGAPSGSVLLPILFYSVGIDMVYTNPIEYAYVGFIASFFGHLVNFVISSFVETFRKDKG